MRPLGAFRFIRTLINNGRIVMRAPPFTGSFTDPRPFLVRSGIHLRTSLPCENSREPGGWRKGGGWRKKLLENLELESAEIFEENLSPPFEMELNRNRSFSSPSSSSSLSQYSLLFLRIVSQKFRRNFDEIWKEKSPPRRDELPRG